MGGWEIMGWTGLPGSEGKGGWLVGGGLCPPSLTPHYHQDPLCLHHRNVGGFKRGASLTFLLSLSSFDGDYFFFFLR